MYSLIRRFYPIYRRSRVRLILSGVFVWLTIVWLTIVIHLMNAQENTPPANQVDSYPVALDGNVLFQVKQGIPGVMSAVMLVGVLVLPPTHRSRNRCSADVCRTEYPLDGDSTLKLHLFFTFQWDNELGHTDSVSSIPALSTPLG